MLCAVPPAVLRTRMRGRDGSRLEAAALVLRGPVSGAAVVVMAIKEMEVLKGHPETCREMWDVGGGK